MDKLKRQTKKAFVGIAGGIVLLLGLIMVPYPGPGWLVVFAGLAILSTEFEFAARIRRYARGKYRAWMDWVKRQVWYVRALIWLFTAAVVVTTVWLLNGFGLMNDWLGLGQDWVTSPLFR